MRTPDMINDWRDINVVLPEKGQRVQVRLTDGSLHMAVYQPQQWSWKWCIPSELGKKVDAYFPVTHWRLYSDKLTFKSQCFHCTAVLPAHFKGCPAHPTRCVSCNGVVIGSGDRCAACIDNLEEGPVLPNPNPCVVKLVSTRLDGSQLTLLELDAEIITLFPPYKSDLFNLAASALTRECSKIELLINGHQVLCIDLRR